MSKRWLTGSAISPTGATTRSITCRSLDQLIYHPKRLVHASDIDPDVQLLGRVVLGQDFDLDEHADTDRAGDRHSQHGARHAEGSVLPGPVYDLLIKSKKGGDAHLPTLAAGPLLVPC